MHTHAQAQARPSSRHILLVCMLGALASLGQAQAADASEAKQQPQAAVLASESPTVAPPAVHFQQLLQSALARDPQVQSAQALLRATQAQLQQARSRWFPTLGVNVNKTKSQDEDQGVPLERKSERVDATVKWNLYAGGTDQASIDSLSRDVAAAELDLQRASEESAEKLATAYAEAVRAESVVATATALMDRLQLLKALVDKQVASGKSSEVDAQTSASSLLEVSITLSESQAAARRARLKLSALSGMLPAPQLAALSLPPSPTLDDQRPPEWQTLREGNVRYLAARLRAESARLKVGTWAALLQPRVDLQVRHALSDRTQPTPTSNTRVSTGLSLSLEMPLGGETFARRDEGLQRAEAAAAEAERISLDAQIEWADAADRLSTARHTQYIHRRQIDHLERVLRGAAVQFEAGRRSLVQLIDLEKMPFSARQKMAESTATQFTAQVRMLALGGGLLDALGRTTVAFNTSQEPVH